MSAADYPLGRHATAYAALARVADRVALGAMHDELVALAEAMLDAMFAGDLDPAADPQRDTPDVQIAFALADGAFLHAERASRARASRAATATGRSS
jgi:hypothetical protein